MQDIHSKLMRDNQSYRTWHGDPRHRIAHWVVFALVVIAGGALYLKQARLPVVVQTVRSTSLAQVTTATQLASARTLTQNTLALTEDHEQAPSGVITTNLVDALEDREDVLVALIEKNKIDEVLNLAISDADRDRMPQEAQAHAEESRTISGTYTWTHEDGMTSGVQANDYTISTTAGQTYTVVYSDEAPRARTGDLVSLEGYVVDGEYVVVDTEAGTSGISVTAQQATLAETQKKVGVIMFNFQNLPATPFTKETVKATTFTAPTSANAYVLENSFGKWGIKGIVDPVGDVYGWYTIPVSSTATCDTMAWSALANQQAQASGMPIAEYDYIVYAFPKVATCSFQGRAIMGGNKSWLNGDSYSLGTLVHELGHNMGFSHASSIMCTDPATGGKVPSGGTCTQQTYGDPFSAMGQASGRKHVSGHNKAQTKAGVPWMLPANIKSVTSTTNGTGLYSLVSASLPSTTGIQTLRVKRALNSVFAIEYRSSQGVFENYTTNAPEVTNGIIVRIVPEYSFSNIDTQLLDMSPATTTMMDAPLNVGQTYFDASSGISIKLESVTDGVASVRITYGATATGASVVSGGASAGVCIYNAPSLTIGTPAGQAGTNVKSYTATITNWSAPSCEPAPIEFSVTAPNGWTMTPSVIVDDIPSQQTITRTFYVSPESDVASGNYPLTFKAKNLAPSQILNQTIRTVTHTINNSSALIAPLVIATPANGASITGNINIAVATLPTPTGAVGVSQIELFLDGALVHTCTSTTSCQKTLLGSTVAPGAHTILAKGTHTTTGRTTTTSVSITKVGTADSPSPTAVSIVSPIANASVSGDLSIRVDRSSLTNTLKIYLDGVELTPSCSGNPCRKRVVGSSTMLGVGQHTVTAKLFNTTGAEVGSTSSTFTKLAGSTAGTPAISITAPIQGATVNGTSFPMTVGVADFANYTSKAHLNGVYVGGCFSNPTTTTGNPCTFNVSTIDMPSGTSTLMASALRRATALGTLEDVYTSITVTRGQTEVVAGSSAITAVTQPANGAVFTGPMTVSVNNTNPSVYAVKVLLDTATSRYCQQMESVCDAYIPTWAVGPHQVKVQTIRKATGVVEDVKTINVTKATQGSILSFTSPAQNAQLAGDAVISVTSANPTTYSTRIFWNDTLKKTCDSGAVCAITVAGSDIANASHMIHAQAIRKSDGAVLEMITRNVTKMIAGTVTINSPTSMMTIDATTQVSTSVSLTSNYELTLRLDGVYKNACGPAQPNCGFNLFYDQLPSGTHTITATLRQNFGGVAGATLDTKTVTFVKP